ncbi:MAG: hypothetical protein CL672_01600 [Balneola sp.]|nr:hypothetical protein [Balneola sp.]|tara:strand:+ start:943 stop:1716 length:774 start_codon:yes stop_codon:yes gene_type:complete
MIIYLIVLSFLSSSFISSISEPETPKTRSSQKPDNPLELIQQMVERYGQEWYTHLTFDQKTTFYTADGQVERIQWWYKALEAPGALAIHFDKKNSGNGILFKDGVQYGYANGQAIQEIYKVHDLLVLGFDIYKQASLKSVEQLRSVGYDMSKMYSDRWQDKAVWVIGVDSPSDSIAQFWIEQERLLFVRSLKPGRAGIMQEVQFNKYEPIKGGWVAPEVIFNMNGQRMLHEEYFNIQVPATLDSAIINPDTFLEATW